MLAQEVRYFGLMRKVADLNSWGNSKLRGLSFFDEALENIAEAVMAELFFYEAGLTTQDLDAYLAKQAEFKELENVCLKYLSHNSKLRPVVKPFNKCSIAMPEQVSRGQ